MRRLLEHRNARLYLAGQITSLFGDSALWLALVIWIKVLTGSTSAAALAWFALAVGSLFGPFGGLVADRVRRRPLLVLTNLLTAALVLTLLVVHDRQQVVLIYVVMLGYGVSGSVLGPAQTALVQAKLERLHDQDYAEAHRRMMATMGDPANRSRFNLLRRLPHVTAPTLFLLGRGDPTSEVADKLQSLVPGSKYHIIESGGHQIHYENADEFSRTVLGFLG